MPNTKTPFLPESRVVAYLRDSGHEEQDLSIAQQESVIREYCMANGLLLIRIFADYAAPGSSTVGRTQFLDMIDFFRSRECPAKGLIIWKYNRFARSMDDAQFYKADLRRRGYIIHSLNDSVPEGLDGRLFEAAVDWMNARYLEDMRIGGYSMRCELTRAENANRAAREALRRLLDEDKLESLEEQETRIQEDIAKAEQQKPESPRTIEQMLQQSQLFQLALADAEEGKVNRILRALIHRITLDMIPEENKIIGNLACYEIPITGEAGSETDPASVFMRMTLCPGRDAEYRHKYNLSYWFILPQKSRSRF